MYLTWMLQLVCEEWRQILVQRLVYGKHDLLRKLHLVFHQEFDLVNHLCFILNFSYILKNIYNVALLLAIGFQMAAF